MVAATLTVAAGVVDAIVADTLATVVVDTEELSMEVLEKGGLAVVVCTGVCASDTGDGLLLLDALETVTTSFFSARITGVAGPVGGLNDVYKLD